MPTALIEPIQDKTGYPFESEGFYRCWWQHLAPQLVQKGFLGEFVIHPVRLFKGLIPIRELRLAGWNYGWPQQLTPERIEALISLPKTLRWEMFRMRLRVEEWDSKINEKLNRAGYRVVQRADTPAYVVDLSGGFEGYLKNLSKNARRNFTRKVKKAETLRPKLVELPTDEKTIDAFYVEFFRHHIPYWDQKCGHSYLNDAAERDFIVAWTKDLARTGNLLLQEVRFNDETVCLSMSIVTGETQYWNLVINTGLYEEYIPGIVGLYYLLEDAARRGIRYFNMGRGDYFYKQQAANSLWETVDVMVFRNPLLHGYYSMRAKG